MSQFLDPRLQLFASEHEYYGGDRQAIDPFLIRGKAGGGLTFLVSRTYIPEVVEGEYYAMPSSACLLPLCQSIGTRDFGASAFTDPRAAFSGLNNESLLNYLVRCQVKLSFSTMW